ncbi:hypothetical protein [Rhodococcus globerulus]|uniref:hypothetical protein n=1 Tax=Rhodococcus globerulus TaxID=33008 RepID=UPI00301899DC
MPLDRYDLAPPSLWQNPPRADRVERSEGSHRPNQFSCRAGITSAAPNGSRKRSGRRVGSSVTAGGRRPHPASERGGDTADGRKAATPAAAERTPADRGPTSHSRARQGREPGATGRSGTRGCERASNRPGTGRRRASAEHRTGHAAAADQGTPKGAPTGENEKAARGRPREP